MPFGHTRHPSAYALSAHTASLPVAMCSTGKRRADRMSQHDLRAYTGGVRVLTPCPGSNEEREMVECPWGDLVKGGQKNVL